MSLSAPARRIAGRLLRNFLVAASVTAIFGFKAADIKARAIAPEMMNLAAR